MPLFPIRAREVDQDDEEMSLDDANTQELDSHTQRIRIKNRRKRYLDLHPEYFKSSELELAGRHSSIISHSHSVADLLT